MPEGKGAEKAWKNSETKRNNYEGSIMDEKEIKRKKMAAAARERRRRHRKKVVMIERITVALLMVVFIVGGTAVVWNLIPGVKVAKQIEAANAYVETQSYDDAIASCEEALKIDSKSVEAYKAMAGVYFTKADRESAEQVLYQGWENTQDESLLQEYCVHLLNDAVADINAQNCTFSTLDKCVMVIEKDQTNEDGYALLDACYERLFASEESDIFCDTDENGISGFEEYLAIMDRMLEVYANTPTNELKAEIIKYAVPQKSFWMNVGNVQDYLELLSKVEALGEGQDMNQLKACLEKALWVQEIFGEAFAIFDSGEFEPIKEFMQSQDYITIRDQFIDGTMEYWGGKTYIPVSREKLKLTNEDGQWSFSFADFEECPETAGVIKVWGVKQEDAGVQRISISYEPVSANGEYYPHTIYEFVYLYSNVKIAGEYVPQMNYRFETRIATPEGTTSELIGDWGGEHEWTTEY